MSEHNDLTPEAGAKCEWCGLPLDPAEGRRYCTKDHHRKHTSAIPEAAVESVARAIFGPRVREWTVMEELTCTSQARRALEAADLRMLADAWDEGFRDCDRLWGQTADLVRPEEDRFVAKNPYRSAK